MKQYDCTLCKKGLNITSDPVMKKFLRILKYIECYVYKLYKNFDLET